MGCDIHVRVEYRALQETVALVGDEIKVVSAVNGEPITDPSELIKAAEWVPAERLVPKEQVEFNRYYLERLHDPDVKEEWDRMPTMELAHEDRFYTGRDYALFGALCDGVRSNRSPFGWEDRGVPDDASPEVCEEVDGWSYDGHTHSWRTLDELLSVDWTSVWEYGGVNRNWFETLERLKDLCFEKCGGDQTAVRIIFWFDN